MLKTVCLVLTLTVVLAESSPINVGTLEFDNLDPAYQDLGYERDDNWWAVFSRLLGPTRYPPTYAKASPDSETTSARISGSKQKSQSTEGVHRTHNSGDLNWFSKEADARDQGFYDSADESARTGVKAAAAAATTGEATRTYAKGNKTTGFHRVYHNDEYKKDQDFYEFDKTKGTVNSVGGKIAGASISADKGFRIGSYDHNRHKGDHGRQGSLDSGFFDNQFSEFEDSNDLDGEFSNFK